MNINRIITLFVLLFIFSHAQAVGVQQSYKYNLLGQLISANSDETERYYHLDALGNILSVSDQKEFLDLDSPIYISPTNLSKLNLEHPVRFSWELMENVSHYEILLGSNESQLYKYKSGLISNNINIDLSDITDSNPRYWQVVAISDTGQKSFSKIASFTALDSDSDTIPDHIERTLCLSELSSDSDGDGLLDNEEIVFGEATQIHSLPCLVDGDGDGIEDAYETIAGTNPLTVDSYYGERWSDYVQWVANKHREENTEIVNQKRVLDLADNNGFAISGYIPDGSPMSLSFWSKHQFDDLDSRQLQGSHDDSNRRYFVGLDKSRNFIFGVGQSQTTTERQYAIDGQWTYVALSYAGREARLFVNGELVKTLRGINFKSASQYALWFGARNQKKAWLTEGFNGVIDDIRVWSKALTAQDVTKSMFNPTFQEDDNLLGFYDFTESRGEWVKNIVSGQFDLKLSSGAKLTLQPDYLDTDGDHIPDVFENAICSDINSFDTDGDGISDGEEFGIGSSIGVTSNPCHQDTDLDGIPDDFEYQNGMNPSKNDVLMVDPDSGLTYWQIYQNHIEQVESNLDTVDQERYLDLNNNREYAISGYSSNVEQTFMYWFKPSSYGDQFSGFFTNSNTATLQLGTDNYSKGKMVGKWSGGGLGSDKDSFNLNEWHHFAIAVKSGTATLYLNGNRVDRRSIPAWLLNPPDPVPLSIWLGALNSSGKPSKYMNGALDDVQIWQRELPQHLIRRYMIEAPEAGTLGLVAYYDFAKSRGSWVFNKANERYDLKLTSTAALTIRDWGEDSDGDGLSDQLEQGKCLNPYKADSDGDGVSDKDELAPLSQSIKSTNPCSEDTDNDGIPDQFEAENDMDPTAYDVGHIATNETENNWTRYAKQSVSQLKTNNHAEQSLNGELELSDSRGYAISGFTPQGTHKTLMYWFKPSSISAEQLSGATYSIYSNEFTLGLDKTGQGKGDWADRSLTASKTLKKDQWNHLAIVTSPESIKLYINGNLESINRGATNQSTSQLQKYMLWFGALNYQSIDKYHQSGQIDDIQIWDQVLSAQDILNHMLQAPDAQSDGLVAFYDFSNTLGDWIKNMATDQYDMKLVKGAHVIASKVSEDADRDGLSDEFEATYCTDSNNSDSDGDGIADGNELQIGTVIDGEKVTTNPCKKDTDNDGVDDLFELENGMNPTVADGNLLHAASGQTNWDYFVGTLNNSSEFQSLTSIETDRELNIEGTSGYAISGYYPTEGDSTFMFWYKPNERLHVYDYAMSGATPISDEAGLALGHDMYGAAFILNRSYIEHSFDDLMNNQWNHLALTVGSSGAKLYLNGQLVEESSNRAIKSTPFPVFLGAINFEGVANRHMNGKLDNVFLWQRELNQQEIRRYMITQPDATSEADLLLAYDFNESKGQWVKNLVTGKYDLTLVKGARLTEEEAYFDGDADGINDKLELASCLDVANADTDGDGLLDGQEYGVNSLYPIVTDPCLWDSDKDNIPDDYELKNSSNPLISNANSKSLPSSPNNNWQSYATDMTEVLPSSSEVEAARVMQLEHSGSYAITNFFPDEGEVTFMYWTQFEGPDEYKLKLSGVSQGMELGFNGEHKGVARIRFDTDDDRPHAIGDWVHLALVYKRENEKDQRVTLYVNGTPVKTQYAFPSEATLWAAYLGASNKYGTPVNHMKGLFDDVGIWSRALNQHEIKQYMFKEPELTSPSLKAWYDFSVSKGDWVKNRATNQYDLKLVHGAQLVAEPTDNDTDNDGLADRLELAFCTDALNADSDGDGLNDGDELGVSHLFIITTNPCDSDTDNDGMPDNIERKNGTDAQIADANFDSDGDGVNNWQEYLSIETSELTENSVESGVLANSANGGYAITPFFPKDSDSTLMYWFKSSNDKSQLSGVTERKSQHYYAGTQYLQHKMGWGEDTSSGYSWNEPIYSSEQWNHIALVVGKEKINFYLNTRLIRSDYRRWSTISKPFDHAVWLGALNEVGLATNHLDGVLDNVQVWERALSDEERLKYTAIMPTFGSEGLVAAYDFSTIKDTWVKNLANGDFDLKLEGDINIQPYLEEDTDADGIPDYIEQQLCIDHLTADTDNDGLFDSKEFELSTNPCDEDTDSDGMIDSFELNEGIDPLIKDADKDSDGDGLSNWLSFTRWFENKHGSETTLFIDGVLNLNGNGDYAITGIYPGSGDKTLIYNVKFSQLKGLLQHLGANDLTKNRYYLGIDKDGDVSFGVGDRGSYSRRKQLNEGVWYTFAMRYKSSTAQIYVDGTKIYSLSYIDFSGVSKTPFYLGAFSQTEEMKAQVDNIQYWDRSLSDHELEYYQRNTPSGEEENLSAFYDFNLAKGRLIHNKATNQYDALLTSPALLVEKESTSNQLNH